MFTVIGFLVQNEDPSQLQNTPSICFRLQYDREGDSPVVVLAISSIDSCGVRLSSSINLFHSYWSLNFSIDRSLEAQIHWCENVGFIITIGIAAAACGRSYRDSVKR